METGADGLAVGAPGIPERMSERIIHDIRNHLNMLEQSVKTDNTDYFEDVHGMLNSLGLKFYSDNRMLNMIQIGRAHV